MTSEEKSNKDIINLKDKGAVMELLKDPSKIAELITGIVSSETESWKLSAGKIMQSAIKGNLVIRLKKEIKKYREEGKIRRDFLDTDRARINLKELLQFIDEEVPDEDRFEAMKSLFLYSVSNNSDESEEVLAYDLMQVCKKLSSGELLLLKAIYNVKEGRSKPEVSEPENIKRADSWLKNMANQLGHSSKELVELHEQKLINLNLISGRRHKDRSGIFDPNTNRLTPLGIKLCDFITKYE